MVTKIDKHRFYIIRDLVYIWIENPLRTWWKARKYFKFPKLLLRKASPVGKWLDIRIFDLAWKDKFNSPRHEINPYISICLFHKFGFTIEFTMYYHNEFGDKVEAGIEYWEYLLDYLYFIKKLDCVPCWIENSKLYKHIIFGNKEDGSEDKVVPYSIPIPTASMSLNKKGIKELKNEIKARNN